MSNFVEFALGTLIIVSWIFFGGVLAAIWHGSKNICWEKFLMSLAKRYGDGVKYEAIPKCKNLLEVVQIIGDRDAKMLIIYWSLGSRFSNKNHISLFETLGCSGDTLFNAIQDPKVAKAKFWDINLPAAYAVNNALFALLKADLPTSGRAPRDPKNLYTERMANWNANRPKFSLYRCAEDKMFLPKSNNGVSGVPDNEATLANYITGVNHDQISFAFAITVHLLSKPGWNDGRHYFKAIGCPKIQNENVYFAFPTSMTRQAALTGVHSYTKQLIERGRAETDSKALGTVVNMFKEWGWDVLKTFPITVDGGQVDNNFCYADFLVPTWSGNGLNCSNELLKAVRNDHNLIIKAMTDYAKGQSGAGTKSAMPEASVKTGEFKFFSKGNNPKITA
jgi:hypothetical protein